MTRTSDGYGSYLDSSVRVINPIYNTIDGASTDGYWTTGGTANTVSTPEPGISIYNEHSEPISANAEEIHDMEDRLIEFYQWLVEEATELEKEDPGSIRCVHETISKMKEFFPEVLGEDKETWRLFCKSPSTPPMPTYDVADYQNLVTYGGSVVEHFREHG